MPETFDPFGLPLQLRPVGLSLPLTLPPPPRQRRWAAGEAVLERPPPQPTAEQRLQALEDEVSILKASSTVWRR